MASQLSTTMITSEQELDRVRSHTATSVNDKIDQKMLAQIKSYAKRSPAEITQHIQKLEKEWDTERVLEANAAVLAFTGLLLGIFVNQNWFWLPGIVLPFLFQHAAQGWCPPLPVIRRLGVRTPHEIDQEKYVLKILRGDFSDVTATSEGQKVEADSILQAVRA